MHKPKKVTKFVRVDSQGVRKGQAAIAIKPASQNNAALTGGKVLIGKYV